MADQKARYRWYKCKADEAEYGPGLHYFLHLDTHESKWTEPEEPFWLYDETTGEAHGIGLQFPKQAERK